MTYYVYSHFDVDNNLLYVGQTKNLRARTNQHRYCSPWAGEIARIETTKRANKAAAQRAERHAIFNGRPKYNVHHNDDFECIPPLPPCALHADAEIINGMGGPCSVAAYAGKPKIDVSYWMHYGIPAEIKDSLMRRFGFMLEDDE